MRLQLHRHMPNIQVWKSSEHEFFDNMGYQGKHPNS